MAQQDEWEVVPNDDWEPVTPLPTPPNSFGNSVINPPMINQPPVSEPTTWWGGFRKGLTDYAGEELHKLTPSGMAENPLLQSAAQPKTMGDMLNLLVLPSNIPNIGKLLPKGKLSQVAESVANPIAHEIPDFDLSLRHPDLVPVGAEPIIPKNPVKSADDMIYEMAQNKFNMGREQPITQPGLGEMHTTVDKSTVAEVGALERMQGMSDEEFLATTKKPTSDVLPTTAKDMPSSQELPTGPQKDKFANLSSEEVNDLFSKPIKRKELEQILIAPSKAEVNDMLQKGYIFDGLDDKGQFKFKYQSEPTGPLESTIGETRGSGGNKPPRDGSVVDSEGGGNGGDGHIGPLADVQRPSRTAEALNLPRAIMASMDFSAPLRQGMPLIHKKQFWTSLDDMFKAWGSEGAFREIQKSIAEKPLFKPRVGKGGVQLPSFAEDAGLKLTDLTDLSKREEMLMSTWAEKIPGVRRSNRAYTSFLNKLRADTFEDLINKGKIFGANGETNLPLAREIANFVNTASGRGSLGKLESSAVALNSMFFSPRLIASRLTMLNPNYYIMANPMVRKEALKSLFAVAAVGNTIGELSKMAGAEVENDPTSSDFRKIKIGDTRIDPFAGFQQYIVAANRLIQGRTKSSTTGQEYNLGEKFGRPTRLDVAGRFAESKLNPVLSFATGMLRGKDFTGQPFNVPEEIASRFVPIFLQDLKQLATENPDLLPLPENYQNFFPQNLPMALPSMFGMGVQQYESR